MSLLTLTFSFGKVTDFAPIASKIFVSLWGGGWRFWTLMFSFLLNCLSRGSARPAGGWRSKLSDECWLSCRKRGSCLYCETEKFNINNNNLLSYSLMNLQLLLTLGATRRGFSCLWSSVKKGDKAWVVEKMFEFVFPWWELSWDGFEVMGSSKVCGNWRLNRFPAYFGGDSLRSSIHFHQTNNFWLHSSLFVNGRTGKMENQFFWGCSTVKF